MTVASIWARLRSFGRRPATVLELAQQGFTLSQGDQSTTILWSEITQIVAFKRDLMTVDLMCLLISTAEMMVEVNEEMPGYEAFEDTLHEALGISIVWKLDVMFPAFETNATQIFPGPAHRLLVAEAP